MTRKTKLPPEFFAEVQANTNVQTLIKKYGVSESYIYNCRNHRISIPLGEGFPLKPEEITEIITNWKRIFTAVAQGPEKWAEFAGYFPQIAGNCDKLTEWSKQ